MKTWIAFLRGVNIGGNKKIKMDALKSLCESLGFDAVKTHLQSGNVVFRSDGKTPAAVLEAALEKKLALKSRVLIRSAAELKSIVKKNPYDMTKRNPSAFLVVFLDGKAQAKAKDVLLAACGPDDEVTMADREIYVYCANGIAKSRLWLLLTEKVLGVTPTARNWNTVTKLLEIAEAM